MIIKIKINGFKSLLNTELYFGPFTCIAGANAIGKSNFFDALFFLSQLADQTVLQAAKSIRSENQKHGNIKDIFFRSGDHYMDTMSFEVDMIVAPKAEDDLGQKANATITSLRYILELRLNESGSDRELIEIVREELLPITQKETRRNLYFENSSDWLKSVLTGRRGTNAPFISTESDKIKLHQDGSKGRTSEFIAQKMPRTLLSTVTAESPTAFLARYEMRNWMMLQFEPSALRQTNLVFEIKNASISANGQNLPATLYRLNNEFQDSDIYQKITNRLKDLVDEIDDIQVDKDEKRDILTLQVHFKDGLILPAQSLSDGTLRFLGLAAIEADSEKNNLICLEEPENGISPKKVKEMIHLLEEMAMSTAYEIDTENPFRQVIINSHSPLVVRNASDESLYFVKSKEMFFQKFNKKISYTSFSGLRDTWKTKNKLVESTTKGDILVYIDTVAVSHENSFMANEPPAEYGKSSKKPKRTVAENFFQTKLDF